MYTMATVMMTKIAACRRPSAMLPPPILPATMPITQTSKAVPANNWSSSLGGVLTLEAEELKFGRVLGRNVRYAKRNGIITTTIADM